MERTGKLTSGSAPGPAQGASAQGRAGRVPRTSVSAVQPVPLWLFSYGDLVTLMLCFMVLMVSLSTLDNRALKSVLGSRRSPVPGEYSLPDSPASLERARQFSHGVQAGNEHTAREFNSLQNDLSRQHEGDVSIEENAFFQTISIHSEALFEPGSSELSAGGRQMVDRALPYIQVAGFPVVVEGHTGPRRDEEGRNYIAALFDTTRDSTWTLSLERAAAVYEYLAASGVPKERLRLAGFGQYQPRFTTLTREGRRKNRRVDLVLDKRNTAITRSPAIHTPPAGLSAPPDAYYKGFRFDLTLPGEGAMLPQNSLENAPRQRDQGSFAPEPESGGFLRQPGNLSPDALAPPDPAEARQRGGE